MYMWLKRQNNCLHGTTSHRHNNFYTEFWDHFPFITFYVCMKYFCNFYLGGLSIIRSLNKNWYNISLTSLLIDWIYEVAKQLQYIPEMSETEFFYRDWDWDFWKVILDIETGIKTFRITVLISRLVLRLLGLQSWYQDWYWDF